MIARWDVDFWPAEEEKFLFIAKKEYPAQLLLS